MVDRKRPIEDPLTALTAEIPFKRRRQSVHFASSSDRKDSDNSSLGSLNSLRKLPSAISMAVSSFTGMLRRPSSSSRHSSNSSRTKSNPSSSSASSSPRKSALRLNNHVTSPTQTDMNEVSKGGILDEIYAVDAAKRESELRNMMNGHAGPSRSISDSQRSTSRSVSPRKSSKSPERPPAKLFDEGSLASGRYMLGAGETEGTADQPIDLEDSDNDEPTKLQSFAPGPSSFSPVVPPNEESSQSTKTRTRKPRRPDLSDLTPSRSYGWLRPEQNSIAGPSTPLSTRSSQFDLGPGSVSGSVVGDRSVRSRERIQLASARRKIREATFKGSDAVKKAGENVSARMRLIRKRRIQDRLRVNETTYRNSVLLQKGNDKGLAAYASILSKSLSSKSVEELITPQPPKPYSPARTREIANDARLASAKIKTSNIDDLISDFEKQRLLEEAAIKARLRPQAPKRMAPQRQTLVQRHLQNPNFDAHFERDEVPASSLARLREGVWLDDNVINFYGALIQSRSDKATKARQADALTEINGVNGTNGKIKSKSDGPLNIHFFNSHFYTRLRDQGYEKARLNRWTKRVDIFSKDMVVFPVNIGGNGGAHWTCAAINFKEKRLEYYDSFGDFGNSAATLNYMLEYLKSEHMDKKKTPFNEKGWTKCFSRKTPQQDNGHDCGVFACQTIEALARGRNLIDTEEFDFASSNMLYLRKLMILEIGQGKLEPRWPSEKDRE